MLGAAGKAIRLFDLFRGTHWTLIGHEVERLSAFSPRKGVRIHATGPCGDIMDYGGHLRDDYGLTTGDWVLVRPDGYVGACVSQAHLSRLERYLGEVGLPSPALAARSGQHA
jgi:hypothetical protein